MKLKIISLFGAFLLVALTGCFERDEPIQPFPRGDVEENSVELGTKYFHQVFFSLERNEIVNSVLRTEWDIAFNCNAGNHSLYTNTGNNIYVAKTSKTKLVEVMDTAGLEFQWDWSNGRDDSTAFAGWDTSERIYVMNLGNDIEGDAIGFIKMKLELIGAEVKITYSRLEENNEKVVTLSKNDTYNRVYYSFATEQLVMVEPPKMDYDIIFRQYIYYFEEEDLPYNVVGALINPYKTEVMRIGDKDFLDIELGDTLDYNFQTNHDVIGYDWKEFNLNEGFYVVYPDKNFVLKNSKGFFYKFHFVDFYNTSGDRGYPKLELKLL